MNDLKFIGDGGVPMRTYYEFGTLRDALDYRRSNGTGGWIFAPDQRVGAICLFPRDMLPS